MIITKDGKVYSLEKLGRHVTALTGQVRFKYSGTPFFVQAVQENSRVRWVLVEMDKGMPEKLHGRVSVGDTDVLWLVNKGWHMLAHGNVFNGKAVQDNAPWAGLGYVLNAMAYAPGASS